MDNLKKKRFSFSILNIKPSEKLHFLKNTNKTCTVFNDTKVEFRGEITSLSTAAIIILKEQGKNRSSANGPGYWLYKGVTLSALRNKVEKL